MAVIGVGTFLLLLPISHNGTLSIIDALFTSTSATCVTGLIVKDTPNDFTTFGQFIILLLIQIGGIGYMTAVTFFFVIAKQKINYMKQYVVIGLGKFGFHVAKGLGQHSSSFRK